MKSTWKALEACPSDKSGPTWKILLSYVPQALPDVLGPISFHNPFESTNGPITFFHVLDDPSARTVRKSLQWRVEPEKMALDFWRALGKTRRTDSEKGKFGF